MKISRYILLAMLVMIATLSCNDFEEINTNPDNPTKVSPDMLATQVLKGTYRFWNPNPSDFTSGNLYNKHIAMLETNPNPYQYYFSYYPYGSFGSYVNLTDLNYMVEFAEGSPYESAYQGLALFLKASFGLSATLDMGDVPYSEAGMATEGVIQPRYDKQADVFVQILNDLEDAEANFASGENFSGDIMFDGDVIKWRKLSNAMQLKVIQTMSKQATADQKARFATLVNSGSLMESNDDNFKLVYSENPNASYPMWNGEERRSYTAISQLAVEMLKNYNDRRLFYFAEPAQALIDGGMSASDFAAYEGAPTELSAEQLALNNQSGI